MDIEYTLRYSIFVGAIPMWFVSLFWAYFVSTSLSHHILVKAIGWLVCFPLAILIGGFIGFHLAPYWWRSVSTVYFGGYGFIAVWIAIALTGHDRVIQVLSHSISEQLNAWQSNNNKPKTNQKSKPRNKAQFVAHDNTQDQGQ